MSFLLVLLACAVCERAPAGEIQVQPVGSVDGAVTFQRLEWGVRLDQHYDNPFDPDQIAVDAHFTGPGGREMIVPAFWGAPRAGEKGEPGFRVRFCAPAAGQWTMTVVAKDARGESRSQPAHFTVAAGPSKGFVRRAPRNWRYLQFDSGDPFFILGLNLAWANGDEKLLNYQRWFEKLQKADGNFARVWVGHPNFMTETVHAGLGRYDQDACAYYDDLLEDAQRHGVYCMLTLNNYRDVRDHDNWGAGVWPLMPYNAANGGPATRPVDFFDDPRCQRLYRQRLRYTVARWSSYTSVACWEFFNEQTFTEVPIAPEWTRGMAGYLRSIDPYRHLVSTSFGANPQAEVWEAPEIDLTQEHVYPEQSVHDCSPSVSSAAIAARRFEKPTLIAELGIDPFASDAKLDPDGAATNMHNGLWSAMMSGAAGGSCMWWWDNYVEPHDLWREFRAAAAFARQVPWNRRKFDPVILDPAVLAGGAGEPETFSDVVVPVSGNWGRSHGQPIDVLPNGQCSLGLPKYIYGPAKPELRTPTVLRVDLPRPAKLIVRVAKVSDCAILRLVVDDEPKIDFPFSALPGAPGQESTKETRPHEFQAVIHQDCALDLPAGKHTVELKNLGGDWVMIESVTLVGARSSRYAELHVLALQDPGAQETLGWIHDPESNWFNDSHHAAPRTIEGAALAVPLKSTAAESISGGRFQVQWWDTRTGEIFRRDTVEQADGSLKLEVPPVKRDIAFRILPAPETSAGG